VIIEPIRAAEQFRLQTSLASTEPKVRVDDVDHAGFGRDIHPERGALFATEKRSVSGQTNRTPQSERMATENGVPIMLVAPLHRRVEMPMPAELHGDLPSLIDVAGTFPA